MAIDLTTKYPGRIDTSDPTGYPQGKFQNETAPAADDGTPSDEEWANDWNGFFQELISAASLTPTGTPDKVGASQYKQALDLLFASITDARFPTSDEKGAMVGSSGTPDATNPYVTDADPRLIGLVSGTFLAQDQKAVGVNGQSLSATIDNTRNLNTIIFDDIGITLNTNQIVGVPAGDYEVWCYAQESVDSPNNGGDNMMSIYDITGAAPLVHQQLETYRFFSEGTLALFHILKSRFTLTVTSTLELRHYTQRATIGGYAVSRTGYNEIYSTIELKKVG